MLYSVKSLLYLAEVLIVHSVEVNVSPQRFAAHLAHYVLTQFLFRCNMTLSVTMFLGLVLALTVSGKPKTYLVQTIDNAGIPVTLIYR